MFDSDVAAFAPYRKYRVSFRYFLPAPVRFSGCAHSGEYDFVSIIEVPDEHAIEHLFRRGILAAGHGSFQVCTLPALPFEEFVKVVDEIRPPKSSGRTEQVLKHVEIL